METPGYFMLLLMCNLFFTAWSAYFSLKPPEMINAMRGDDVKLNWTFSLENDERLLLMQLEYKEGSDQLDNSSQMIAFSLKNNVSVISRNRVNVEPSGSLTLYNVTLEQSGFYTCTVLLENKAYSISNTIKLFVGTPPVISSSLPSNITLLKGDQLNMSCVARGHPVPEVSWYKLTQYGWQTLGNDVLQINTVKLSDTGSYKCEAVNTMATVEKLFKVNVYERPIVTAFYHTSSLDDTVHECESITFACEARDSIKPITNIFIFGGRFDSVKNRLTNVVVVNTNLRSTGLLRIDEVRKEHEGMYYCIAENQNGLSYNKSIELKVKSSPKNCERKRNIAARTKIKLRPTSFVNPGFSYTFSTTENSNVFRARSGSEKHKLHLFLLGICLYFYHYATS